MAQAAASNLKRRILGPRLESNSNTTITNSNNNSSNSNGLNSNSIAGTSNGSLTNGAAYSAASSISSAIPLSTHSQLSVSIEHPRLRIDRRCIEKVWKQMDRIVKYCQYPKMNLKNSPPYMLDILPDMYQTLRQILTNYDDRLHILNDIDYFRIFMGNLIDKCSKTIDCFKRAGHSMYDEQSSHRKHLTKFSLYFSHILVELKSLFPKGMYEGEKFRITKPEAADFWKKNFNERTIVPWEQFKDILNRTHPIQSGNESAALQNTIDLTNNNYVSIFEFDVFTRLFHPWSSLLTNWKLLAVTHPAFMAFMTYDEVKAILTNFIDKPGSYVFRLSCTRLGQWAIGYVTANGTILQTIPQTKPLIQSLIDGEREGYYKYPNGRTVTIDLSSALQPSDSDRIYVSEEQYAIYCDMGTSFELCKICNANNKDSKIQPCGHLLCKECLHSWQSSMSKMNLACPFCRAEIKGFEPVVISPFENNLKQTTEQTTNDMNDFDDHRLESNMQVQDLATLAARPAQNESSDPLDNISPTPPPIPPRPLQKLEKKENDHHHRSYHPSRRNHGLPPLHSTFNDINDVTPRHSQTQPTERLSPFTSSNESLNDSFATLATSASTFQNGTNHSPNSSRQNLGRSTVHSITLDSADHFRTIDDVSRRLLEVGYSDEVRIQAALTLTNGLNLTKQFEMAKKFLDQVQQQHEPNSHNTFVNGSYEQE